MAVRYPYEWERMGNCKFRDNASAAVGQSAQFGRWQLFIKPIEVAKLGKLLGSDDGGGG